jgi:transcriptional regulator with XRE-family HTH domain
MKDILNYGPPIDATGTARRLRALVATGHQQSDLADRLGLLRPYVSYVIHGRLKVVSAGTFAAVHALFVELWEHPIQGREGDYPRAIAAFNGWVGPLAWDEIDDPTELPNLQGRRPEHTGEKPTGPQHINTDAIAKAMKGERVVLTDLERLVAVTKLHTRGWVDKRIAATLRIDERRIRVDLRSLGITQPAHLARKADVA